jgi:hypothetical protein
MSDFYEPFWFEGADDYYGGAKKKAAPKKKKTAAGKKKTTAGKKTAAKKPARKQAGGAAKKKLTEYQKFVKKELPKLSSSLDPTVRMKKVAAAWRKSQY